MNKFNFDKLILSKLINKNKLYESIFDDETFDNIIDDESVLDKYLKNNLDNILVSLLGVKKPKGWVKHKDNNDEWVEFYKEGTDRSSYVTNVEKVLLLKGFNKYTSYQYTDAFNNSNIVNYDNFKKYLYNTLFYRAEYRIQEMYTLFMKWYHNNWQNYPYDIQQMFLNDSSLKEIYMSLDNGIMLSVYNPAYSTGNEYFVKKWYIKAILKLTGNVLYSELGKNELKNKMLSHKNDEKKITFLKSGFRNACKSNQKIFKRILEYKLDNKGYPYGITYFSWNGNPKIIKRSDNSTIKIPLILKEMLSTGFHFLNELEKTDDTATYELTNKSILLKIYKNVDCSGVNNGNKIYSGKPDSYIKIELDDYLLDQYKLIFKMKD